MGAQIMDFLPMIDTLCGSGKMKKIAITTTSFGKYNEVPLGLVKEQGYEITMNNFGRKLIAEEIVEICQSCIGIIAGTEVYNKDTLEKLKNLRVISRCGVGIDNIDLATARDSGIRVLNTPDAPTFAVAELTVGLILNFLRKINQMDRGIREGKWEKRMGNLLYAKNVGIIGFGRIGQKVAELLSGFGLNLAYYDTVPKSCPIDCSRKEFEEIIRWADILTLHLSPSSGCNPIVGKKELELMKKGGWLVNVSRGGMVDEGALYCALKDGHLSGAALDVFDKEPYEGPLKELDNVLLTPHVGSYAKEARIKMEVEAAENLLIYLKELLAG